MTKRRKFFLVVFFLIQLALIWPVYPLFSGIEPLILGLPLSFAWVIAVLLASFALILWYYLSDPNLNEDGE